MKTNFIRKLIIASIVALLAIFTFKVSLNAAYNKHLLIARDNFKHYAIKSIDVIRESDCIVSVATAPDKENIIYFITSDGNLYISEDFGKTSFVAYQFKNSVIVPDSLRKVFMKALPNGYVLAMVRNNFKTYLAFSDDYGKTWKTHVLDVPVYSMDVSKEDPNTIYIGTISPSHELSENSSIPPRGVLQFNLKNMKLSNYNLCLFGSRCAPVTLLKTYKTSVYYSLEKGTYLGTIILKNYLHLDDAIILPDTVFDMVPYEVKGNTEIILACDKLGILRKNLKDGKVQFLNRAIIKSSLSGQGPASYKRSFLEKGLEKINRKYMFQFNKDLFINPVKILLDEKHMLAFLATEQQGVFVCDLKLKNPVWYSVPEIFNDDKPDTVSLSNPGIQSHLMFYKINSKPYYNLNVGITNIEGGPMRINDMVISHNPYGLLLATDTGLVVLTFENLH